MRAVRRDPQEPPVTTYDRSSRLRPTVGPTGCRWAHWNLSERERHGVREVDVRPMCRVGTTDVPYCVCFTDFVATWEAKTRLPRASRLPRLLYGRDRRCVTHMGSLHTAGSWPQVSDPSPPDLWFQWSLTPRLRRHVEGVSSEVSETFTRD